MITALNYSESIRLEMGSPRHWTREAEPVRTANRVGAPHDLSGLSYFGYVAAMRRDHESAGRIYRRLMASVDRARAIQTAAVALQGAAPVNPDVADRRENANPHQPIRGDRWGDSDAAPGHPRAPRRAPADGYDDVSRRQGHLERWDEEGGAFRQPH
jgi:hypothetical protein